MTKRDAIIKLEHVEWAFFRHVEAKMVSDLKVTNQFKELLQSRIAELIKAIEDLP
jgi:hypothetical protein